jgi:hypothetical protein
MKRDDLTNPFWMEDQELKKGNVDFLSSEEELFWKDLIDKYLYPLEATKKQTVKCKMKNVEIEIKKQHPHLGSNGERVESAQGQDGVWIFHAERHVRYGFVPHSAEQRPTPFELASGEENKHHV